MRASFDFKILVDSYDKALSEATLVIASFMSISPEEVEDKVDIEIKISYPKAETAAEIAITMDEAQFVVHVFGSVKRSMAKPFGA